jgi:tetratricopeptide (TPR) repeat protein
VLQWAREAAAGYTEAAALIGLAEAHRSLGRLGDAGQHAERALALAQRSGYQSLEGQARTALAAVHRALGQPEQARAEAQRALDLHRTTGHRPGERRTQRLLAGLPDDPGAELDPAAGAVAGPAARRPAIDAGPPH